MIFKRFFMAFFIFFISSASFAQEFQGLVEGKDYIKAKSVDTIIDSKKPVVIEFFWYGCGHCFAIKALSSELFKKYGSKIENQPYPVAFDTWKSGAQIFFTLEQMGKLKNMHDKVFNELHVNRKNILKKQNELELFLETNNIDTKEFNSIYNSFGMMAKVNKSKQIISQLQIESTPTYVVYYKGNTYKTSPGLVNSYEKTIFVLDTILAQITK